jgi:O-antigen ligase
LVGLGFALYGLWVFVGGNQGVLWLPKDAYPESLSASFISRNHAATLLGLGVLASLGLALLRVGEISGQLPLAQRLKALWRLVLRPGLGWWLVLAVQWCALVLTSSRAGLGVSLVAVLVLVAALAWARAAVRWWLLGGAGLLALVGFLVLALLGGTVADRSVALVRDAAEAGGRAQLNTLSWRAAIVSPWWGHGYGGWEAAVAVVRTAEIWPASPNRFENAHNLYAQTLVELGWPGLMGLLALGGVALAGLLHGLATRRRQVMFPAVGLAALVLVALHSAVDFPLHIPAVMLAWLLLLAAGLGQAFRVVPEQMVQPLAWPWRVGGAGVALGVLVGASWLAWAQSPAWQVGATLRALEAGQSPSLAAMQQARTALGTCLARAPWHVGCGEALTLVHLNRAGQVGPATVNGQVLLKAAELQAKRTLQYAPANPVVAYRLARALALQGQTAAAQTALTTSVLVGPYEPRLAYARAWLLVAALRDATLSPEDAALYQANLAGLWRQPRLLWHNLRNEPAAAPILAAALQANMVTVDPVPWEKITRTHWPAATPLGNPVAPQ